MGSMTDYPEPHVSDVLLHQRDARGVHRLTLNSPANFNSLSKALLSALQQALNHIAQGAQDAQARVVALGLAAAAGCQLAGQTMACNRMDEVAQEGVQAFTDKRTPAWRA